MTIANTEDLEAKLLRLRREFNQDVVVTIGITHETVELLAVQAVQQEEENIERLNINRRHRNKPRTRPHYFG
jgi:hypothetical protein